jgi:soluble lytic murein transglycosylase
VADLTAQVTVYWLEALYMYNEAKNAILLSYKVAKRFQDRFSAANLVYIAALADKYGLPGEAMQLTAFLAKRNSNMLNAQTLKFIYPKPFQKTFDRIAKKVDPLLTLSVAKQESGFNPYARSPANARGLLQILPSTAEIYEPRSKRYLYDIDTNVEVGGKILADLINRLGRTEYALAAYNAGFNRVEDWKKRYDTDDGMLFIDLIPYSETRGYVANVLRNHYWYTSLYGKTNTNYR